MTLQEIGCKDVIQIKSGENLGRIDDIDLDIEADMVKAVILHGRAHFFGLLGRDEDLVIPWSAIKNIGTDVVMTDAEALPPHQPRRKWYW